MAKSSKALTSAITVRGLAPALKLKLKRRAVDNDRSMEDEVRSILAGAVATAGAAAGAVSAPEASRPAPAGLRGARVVLVIGGGIAAYKALDLIRRLREAG